MKCKFINVLLSLLMVLTLISPVHVGALTVTNVALGKTVSASSTATGKTIGHVVDGKAESKQTWQNHYNGSEYNRGNGDLEEYLIIDLENISTINEIDLTWTQTVWAHYINIEGSMDGESYFDIIEVTSNNIVGDMQKQRIVFDEIDTRFVKFTFNNPNNLTYGYEIYEVEVLGEEHRNIALNKDATASSTYDETKSIAFALDGDMSTRWGNAYKSDAFNYGNGNKEESILIDLENVYALDALSITWESAYANKYTIQGSIDNETYFDIKDVADGNGNTDHFDVDVECRYIRIDLHDCATKYGYSIYEMNAYGEKIGELDKSDLEVLISEMESIEESLYTKDSFEYFQNKINEAKELVQNNSASSQDIIDAYNELLSAKENLVLASSLAEKLEEIIDIPPTINDEGTAIILPEIDLKGYKVVLYGSSNESVIALDGTIYKPLEDKDVNVSYKIVSETNEEDCVFDNYREVTITIPGLYNKEVNNNERPQVLPSIQEWKGHTGHFALNQDSRLVYEHDELKDNVDMIAFYFEEMLGRKIEVVKGSPKTGDIYFSYNNKEELGEEGYLVEIGDIVRVGAYKLKGILYAGATLTQILSLDNNKQLLPKGIIRDYPAFEIRSMMIDVGRLYVPLAYLEEMSKYMAYFKINEVHVHMNDTGGEQNAAYRIESKLYPQINSNLKPGQVYSQEDYKQFQKNVFKYGIDVVTELDTPAHAGFVKLYDKSLVFSDKYIDLTNRKSVEFIQSLVDELLDGEDPVIQSQKFHLGADEYPTKHQDLARAYADEMIKYVANKGYEPRIWAALGGTSGLGGNVEVSTLATCNAWSPHYSDPKAMIDKGYRMINDNRTYLYVVPGSDLDRNIFNIKKAYNNWNVEDLPGVTVSTSTPLLRGAEAAFWYDNDRAISEFDTFRYVKDQFIVIAEKSWVGKDVGTAEEFIERIDLFDDYTPGSNPYRHVKSESEIVVNYDFETDNQLVIDHSGNNYHAKLNNVETDNEVLQLNKEGCMSLPFDTMGFPYTVSFDLYLDEECEENAVFFTGEDANGTFYFNYNGTGKLAYERKDKTYVFDYIPDMKQWHNYTLTCDDKDLTLYIDGILFSKAKAQFSQSISSTFALPLERIGEGVVGQLDNFVIVNKWVGENDSYDESLQVTNLALNKPVQVSGLEVTDGRMTGEMAVDGDTSTRVSFHKEDEAWFVVDLEDIYWINEIEILFGELPNQYKVLISEDGQTWEEVYEDLYCAGGNSKDQSIEFIKGKKARYVKYQQLEMFTSEENGRQYSGNFNEFRVFGSKENAYIDLINEAKDILENTDINDTNKAFLSYLSDSIDLIENYIGTRELLNIALEGLKENILLFNNEEYGFNTDKSVLKSVLEYKLSNDTLYDFNYRKALSIYMDIYASQEDIDHSVNTLYEYADNLNVALLKPVYTNVGNGSKVTDGIIGGSNYWDGSFPPASFVIDLEHEYYMDEFKVYPYYKEGQNRIYKYEIYVSSDNETWEKVVDKKEDILEKEEGTTYTFENKIKGRYIKVNMTENNYNEYVHMSEFEVYGHIVQETHKEQLKQMIDTVNTVNKDLYTEETYAVFANALSHALSIYEDETCTQKDINDAYKALDDAYQALKEKEMIPETDKSALLAQYEAVSGTEKGNYTDESYQAFTTALVAAKEMLDNDEATQEEVDTALANLTAAYAGLKEIEKPVEKPFPFEDVFKGQWYYEYVDQAYQLGLMTGSSDSLFKPAVSMNRGMVAIVLHRMEGAEEVAYAPIFPDVYDKQYFTTAVMWAKQTGIITGYNNGTFMPLKEVTREEMATMIQRFAKYKGLDVASSKDITYFQDYADISTYAKAPIQWCVENGVLSGKFEGTKVDPLGTATRAECAKMLVQAYKVIYK